MCTLGAGDGCAEDAKGSSGGVGQRDVAFGAFVRHLVCRETAFPAGTVVRDVPAAVAQDLPLADAQGLESHLASGARHARC
jgi:hypothetical protein